jgi:uncharacterized phiE125 gp8 family phage protein
MPIIKTIEESENLLINLENIKLFLKIDYDDEDEVIIRSFKTALKQCELMIGQSLIEKKYQYSFYSEVKNNVHLIYGPVISVDSIVIIDSQDRNVVISEENYFLDSITDSVILKKVPTSFYRLDIFYTAGSDNIADDLQQAMLFHTAKIFEDKLGYSPIPRASYNIYRKYKTTRL